MYLDLHARVIFFNISFRQEKDRNDFFLTDKGIDCTCIYTRLKTALLPYLCFFCTFVENYHLFFRKNISKQTDEELLELYKKSGNTEYFGELYNRYTPLLYGVCLKYLHDADKAQDAVMQLFENLLPKISNYEIGVFRTWIHSVVKNHCLQILRKESRQIIVDLNVDIMESDDILHLLNEEVEDEEQIEALKRCIEKLPEEQRISIVNFFMEEMSYADIVEKTGYTLSRVKSYIQNGKRNLKICIEKQTRNEI